MTNMLTGISYGLALGLIYGAYGRGDLEGFHAGLVCLAIAIAATIISRSVRKSA